MKQSDLNESKHLINTFFQSALGRRFSIAFLTLLIAASIYAAVVFSLIRSQVHTEAPADVPLVIVLGAQVWGNIPAYPSHQLAERLDAALVYLRDNPQTKVLVTGGKGSDEAEAEGDVMARYLIEHGIDEARIIVENRSTSTIENFRYSMDLLPQSDIIDGVFQDDVVIVTNDYHMYRSLRSARQNAFPNVHGLSAASRTSSKLKSYAREIIALAYHLIFTH